MKKRALVLSGGGQVGVGWEVGLLAGLAEAGVDPRRADFVLGTSAGAVVGAQIARGVAPVDLADALRNDNQGPGGPAPDLSAFFRKMIEAGSGERPARDIYAEIGADALQAQTMSEERFLAMIGQVFTSLSDGAWPKRDFACTAFNAATGDMEVWRRESGVDLTRAIASSCVVPRVFPPVTLGKDRYIDGGLRSRTNAQLARGYERILIISLDIGEGASEMTRRIGAHYAAQTAQELEVLRAAGAETLLLKPDLLSRTAFGPNLMDTSRRPGAIDAGVKQGLEQAGQVAEFWS